jgi:hypothetical protein
VQAFRLVVRPLLVQKAQMIRRLSILLIVLAVAGCAANAPPPRPVQAAPVPGAIPPAPPRGEPGQYLNMAASGLQAAFGRPAFVRKDGSTEMWRYDGAACRAFFFLYWHPPCGAPCRDPAAWRRQRRRHCLPHRLEDFAAKTS